MSTPQELHRLVQVAAVYDLIVQCADGTMSIDGFPQGFAEIVRNMLTDPTYRSVAEEAWADLFRGKGLPTDEVARKYYEDIDQWTRTLKQPEFLFATDTEDTPPTSKPN